MTEQFGFKYPCEGLQGNTFLNMGVVFKETFTKRKILSKILFEGVVTMLGIVIKSIKI